MGLLLDKSDQRTMKINSSYLKLAISSLLFGFISIFSRILGMPAYIQVFFRFLIAAIFLYILLKIRNEKIKINRKDFLFITAISVVYILTAIFFVKAVQLTEISTASFIFYLFPLYVFLFSRILLRAKLARLHWASLFIALLGMSLIFLNSGGSALSDNSSLATAGKLYAFAGSILYALNVILSKNITARYSGQVLTTVQCLIGSIILAPFVIFSNFDFSSTNIIVLLLLGVVVWAGGISLMFDGLKKVSAPTASIIMFLDPVSAVLYGIILFSEIPNFYIALGSLMILISAIIISTSTNAKNQ
jgi:drug/metabolite transporter (DMT)-like permease